MSDTEFDEELELNSEEEVETRNPARENQRRMERELKESKAREKVANEKATENESAKRELAFLKAGIDTNSPQGKLLLKAYDGENTVDAIKAAGEEYGLIATSQTTEIANDLKEINQVSSAAKGSSATLPVSVFDEMKTATSEAEVLAIYAKHGIPLSTEAPGDPYSIV